MISAAEQEKPIALTGVTSHQKEKKESNRKHIFVVKKGGHIVLTLCGVANEERKRGRIGWLSCGERRKEWS
jgi:hypothetical protein